MNGFAQDDLGGEFRDRQLDGDPPGHLVAGAHPVLLRPPPLHGPLGGGLPSQGVLALSFLVPFPLRVRDA